MFPFIFFCFMGISLFCSGCSVWVNVDFFYSCSVFKLFHFSLSLLLLFLFKLMSFIARCRVEIMIGMLILMTKSPNKTSIRAII